jgi:hypothetical protein
MSNKKKLIRERMAKTGESYQAAQRHLVGGGGGDGGSIPFEVVVRKIIHLAVARAVEMDGLRPENPIMDVPTVIHIHSQPKPEADRLRAALAALDYAQLRKLELLMYAGREDDDFRLLHDRLAKDSAVVTASILQSKRSLASYLEKGLAYARRDGIDLDAVLPEA